MRIAVTKGTLAVPPTYFAVQHAVALRDRFDFRVFAGAVEVSDPAVSEAVDIVDMSRAVPLLKGRPYPNRERIAPALGHWAARAVQAWRPDLVHQHFANLSTGGRIAANRLGVPFLLTVHGADVYLPLTSASSRPAFSRPLFRRHQATVKRAFDSAQRILAVSEYLAGVAVLAGADAAKVQVHYQGVDTDLFTPTGERPDAPPTVVFVGALSQAKGVRDLIEASARVRGRHEHRLVLVGDGPLRAFAEDAAAQAPTGSLTVAGRVDRAGVRDALSSATAFVLPAQQSGMRREAAGLVTLEAQAMGVPAIVYDSGGAAEMVDADSSGLVIPERDVPALADAIEQMIMMGDAEWRAMSTRARNFVVERRSLRASSDELADHYVNLMEAM